MSLLRPTLAPLKAYVPTPPQPGHRLHLNESPEDLPADLKAAAVERLLALDWSRYPEEAELLAEDLARADGWRADGVMLGNGSNELLQLLVIAALAPGDAIVVAAPSFSLYATQAKAAGAKLVEVPMRASAGEPFRFDVDRLAEAARESRARLVLVATPNNPTGTLLSSDEVKRLHDGTDCVVAIDEAYRHFADQDLAPLLASSERLVLLRTFSKSFAAAALRLGYLLASPELCHELRKLQMPYNLGAASAALARELLRRPELVRDRVAQVVSERARMSERLATIPSLRVEPGGANFVVIEHATKTASSLASALAARGVLVRDLGGYAGCERCVRISVGSPAANDAVLAALAEVS
jgi:histidinol-phosphate aminotransferase